MHRQGYWSGTSSNLRKNSSVYREWRSIRSAKDAGGTLTHYVHVFYQARSGLNDAGVAAVSGRQ